MKKQCSICGEIKEIIYFYRNKKAKNGYQKHCKQCHNKMSFDWWHKNIDKRREISRKSAKIFRAKYPQKIKEQRKKYYELYGEKYKKNSRERLLKFKKIVIEKYGGKCICCGESDYRFLCLDHKNNNGNQYRKKGIARNLIYWAYKNNFPNSLQLMCFNCNFGRAFFGGKEKICPHKLRVQD